MSFFLLKVCKKTWQFAILQVISDAVIRLAFYTFCLKCSLVLVYLLIWIISLEIWTELSWVDHCSRKEVSMKKRHFSAGCPFPSLLHFCIIFFQLLCIQMLVIYITSGGVFFIGRSSVGTSVYFPLERSSESGLLTSFRLFLASNMQKLRPMNRAAVTMKKLEA